MYAAQQAKNNVENTIKIEGLKKLVAVKNETIIHKAFLLTKRAFIAPQINQPSSEGRCHLTKKTLTDDE